MLHPGAFGFLNAVDPSVSVSNYYKYTPEMGLTQATLEEPLALCGIVQPHLATPPLLPRVRGDVEGVEASRNLHDLLLLLLAFSIREIQAR